jgi:hypothetical protein
MVEALHRPPDRADEVAFAADAVDGVIRRGEIIKDSFGESVKDFRKLASRVSLSRSSNWPFRDALDDFLLRGEEVMNNIAGFVSERLETESSPRICRR